MMLSRSALVVARRAGAVRNLSTTTTATTPKLHKAKGKWAGLKSKRPIDEDETHLVFHPPFNPATIFALVGVVITIGYGSMQYGFIHQQYKQGYWKK